MLPIRNQKEEHNELKDYNQENRRIFWIPKSKAFCDINEKIRKIHDKETITLTINNKNENSITIIQHIKQKKRNL